MKGWLRLSENSCQSVKRSQVGDMVFSKQQVEEMSMTYQIKALPQVVEKDAQVWGSEKVSPRR